MKLLTLNCHSILEPDYQNKLLHFVDCIAQWQPDVFALQEVNQTAAQPTLVNAPAGYSPCPGNPIPLRQDNHAAAVAKALEERGIRYFWSWLPAKIGYGKYDEGVALFSKGPIIQIDNLLLSRTKDYTNWKTRRTLGISSGGVWYYTMHMGWWKDEEEPFADQWQRFQSVVCSRGATFLLGDFNSDAAVRGEGYDLVAADGWQDTYLLAEQKDDGYTVVQAIDGWRDSPDADAKKRIDQIWCSEKLPIKSSTVAFNGKQGSPVSDHAGILIEY